MTSSQPFIAACLLMVLLLVSIPGPLFAVINPLDLKSGIEWHRGPYQARLGDVAEIDIPAGYAFTDGAGARRYMDMIHNPAAENQLGLIVPAGNDADGGWFVVFEYDETGYVPDNERSSLDEAKLLASLKKNTEDGNRIRRQMRWPSFHLTGWQQAPVYDIATHDLAWATIGLSEDASEGKTVNYSTRMLGRHGTMSADLVLDPSQLELTLPAYRQLLDGFAFTPGNRYGDYVEGDRRAPYGLSAVIAAGATATATRFGLLPKLAIVITAILVLIAVTVIAARAKRKKS
ncbi:MAG: DUF2167 domain-containing protein [Acidobacteriaceae bacterium]|nr:DUF2167 domain-containing protein [Acidobacteriaceae bacterium]